MTAQTNDPMSAFAYPDPSVAPTAPTSTTTDNAMAVPTPMPTTLPTPPQADLNAPLSSPVQQTPATMAAQSMNDMSIPTVAPTPVLPEVTETPLPVMESTPDQESAISQPVTAPDPMAAQMNSVQPEPVVKEEENESPLQALARKLTKLREELIKEVPDEKEVTPLDTLATTPMVADASNEVMEPVESPVPQQSTPVDMPVPMEPNQVQSSTPAPVMPKEENVAADLAALNAALTKAPEDVVVPETPVIPEVPSEDINTAPVAEPTVVNPLPDLDQVSNPVQPAATLQQLYPEVVDKPAQSSMMAQVTPNMTAEVNNNAVVDENDNTQVDPIKVEMESAQTKYPININKIMDIAIERNASDIQISVGYPVMIRIDGTLISANDQVITPANAEELILPVLSEQKKELLEVNREVDLAYSPLHNAEARFRINAYYAKNNLAAAFRLIPSKIRTLDELNLPPLYTQLTKLSQGFVLVTGPTGHGKSTTLAAMIQTINMTRAAHIITIEDPIEYVFKPAKAIIDQREMHDDTHSWTVALKSALRQDPDVILVGEMRDYETIASAITLAETGHLVFATLHTNSAAQTVDRIIDVFPENQQAQIRTQLANILEAVIAQRLLPIEGGGRRAVSEIMLGTPAVRNLIREGKTHQLDNVIRTSADVGMFSLEQSLVKLVRDGLITMDRAQEYAVHPEEVVRLLKS